MRANPTWLTLLLTICVGGLSACGKDEAINADQSPVSPDSGPDDGADDDDDDDAQEDDESTDDSTDDDLTDDANGGMGGAPGGRPGADDSTVPDPGPPPGSSGIGRPCSFDDDCSEGLTCMTSDSDEWFGGGPAHGYCTLDCEAGGEVCIEADPGAVCLQTEGSFHCMLGCSIGQVDKCHSRGDVACDAASINGVGFCRPVCRSDDDCDGRFCDLGLGSCTDVEPEGDPIGAACDPEAAIGESNCASQVCLPMGEEYAFCSGFCNLTEIGCGSDNQTPEEPGEPICTYGVLTGSGQNDLGFCAQRCNCDGECAHDEGVCLILPEDLRPIFGSDGICVDPAYPDDSPDFTVGRACADEPGGDSGVLDSGMSSGDDGAEAGPDQSTPEAGPTDVPDAAPASVDATAEGGN